MLTEEKINKIKSKVKSAHYAVSLIEAYHRSFSVDVSFSIGNRDEDAVRFAAEILKRIESK